MKFNKNLMACMGGCAKSNEESAADGVTSFTSNGASSANVDEPKPEEEEEENKKWYLVSFTVAILWIALISWLMVECSEVVGCLLEIDSYTMGLVVIATGTSVPDALSSILVAREGYGNMAVSNAIGSNVFDINR